MKTIFKKIITIILTRQARMVLWKYKPTIVAVTGSVGKTTTKDAIHALLQSSLYVRKSEKSYNSDIGVPLTILGRTSGWGSPSAWLKNIIEGFMLFFFTNHYPKVLILEVGADRPGDIKRISKWLKPDVVVVTRFGDVPAHVEFFKTVDDVIKEKAHLITALKPDGLLVLNNDDAQTPRLKKKYDGAFITYGTGVGSGVHVTNVHPTYTDTGAVSGTTFKVEYKSNSIPFNIEGVAGDAYVSSVLAGLAVGMHMNVNMIRMGSALQEYRGTAGRMRIVVGVKGSTILDDTYNASPLAVLSALDTLKNLELQGGGKRIVMLGDMLELGKYTQKEHERIGATAAASCDLLVAVGQYAEHIARGAVSAGMKEERVLQYTDAREAGGYVSNVLGVGDVVLVKGSQGVRMERAVVEMMAYPQERDIMLVRQEKEWKTR